LYLVYYKISFKLFSHQDSDKIIHFRF